MTSHWYVLGDTGIHEEDNRGRGVSRKHLKHWRCNKVFGAETVGKYGPFFKVKTTSPLSGLRELGVRRLGAGGELNLACEGSLALNLPGVLCTKER